MLVLVALVLANVVLFWPSYVVLHTRWINPEEPYSYSYLVLLMAAYLTWGRIKSLDWNSSPYWPGLLIVLSAVSVWFLGYVTQVQALSQLALPAILWSWILVILGKPVARQLILPILFIYLTIPIWGFLGVPLRTLAVAVVSVSLDWVNIPAAIDGFRIHLPAGIVEVAGGCSGQNYLITGLVIGSFYAICYLKGWSRLLCIGLLAGLALLANWIRIFSLVIIGHNTELQHPLMSDHNNYGWFVFAAVLVLFFVIMHFISPWLNHVDTRGDRKHLASLARVPRLIIYAFSVTMFVSLVLPALAYNNSNEASEGVVGINLPSSLQASPEAPSWLPAYEGYDISKAWRVDIADKPSVVTALIYNNQTQGKELIYSSNRIAESSKTSNHGTVEMDGHTLGYADVLVSDQVKRVFWIYKIGDWYTASLTLGKLMQVPAMLLGKSQSALITFSYNCQADCNEISDIDKYAQSLGKLLPHISWQYESH